MESRGPDYSSVPGKDPFNCLESDNNEKEENRQHVSSSVKWRLKPVLKCHAALTFDCSRRYAFACLGGVGMAIIYGLKVNISVAIVAMVNHTAIQGTSDQKQSNVNFEDGPFAWSSTEQGVVLGSYFVGYFLTQVSYCQF